MQGSKNDKNVEGIEAFRERVKQARETNRVGWERSRKLVGRPQLGQTLAELAKKVQQSSFHETIKERVMKSLPQATSNESLTIITGH